MKFIYILLSLLFITGCSNLKSSEEGEMFLEEVTALMNYITDDFGKVHAISLLEAEYIYEFTDEQLLRLKLMQISLSTRLREDIEKKFLNDIIRLCRNIDNDSITDLSYLTIITSVRRNSDSLALALFDTREHLLKKRGDLNTLRKYYLAISYIFHRNGNLEECLVWHKKARPAAVNLKGWLNQHADYLLTAHRYEEALRYADTCCMMDNPTNPTAVNGAYYVKSEALAKLGRVDEALVSYKNTYDRLINFTEKKGINTFSPVQSLAIYGYASLLYEKKEYRNAIDLLHKLPEKIDDKTLDNFIKQKKGRESITVKFTALMSDCYYELGDSVEAQKYKFKSDSIQAAYHKRFMEIERDREALELKYNTISDNLYAKKELLLKRESEIRCTSIYYAIGIISLIIIGIIIYKLRK